MAVPEYTDNYEGGVLYSFYIGTDGNVYGRSYGIDESNIIKEVLPITLLISSNIDELCVSVGADYIYDVKGGPSMFAPINIMIAVSCKYCRNGDGDCSLPQWRIMAYNLKYVELSIFINRLF